MKRLTLKRLFKLADEKKSVLWVAHSIKNGIPHSKKIPAAFVQNWGARHLNNMLTSGIFMEVK